MNPLRWERLDQLFAAAEGLPAEERAALIERSFAAEPDPELRRELEQMLAAAGTRVDQAIADGLAGFSGFAEGEKAPDRLGPYRILHEIGRGGMATVYEAERDDREFERRVAVKVLRRGMDTADIVRRLRRERQILANLDHPNIARLLDGGSTPDGRPYVVMEHIAGLPIDRYCETQGLDLADRLALFRQICGAVHFAHQSLVLHRDIKPSNILVTAEGVPKLLDFGIAKVLAGDGDGDGAEPEPTLTGLRLLTPEWASPEQLRGEPLTTASDVYSLGLLLYLLVTGQRAYQADPKRPAELERLVCEAEPKSPGRGDDLEVVLLAALRKEPARRYASAEQLGEDVRRFLENLPVSARKDTLRYRAAKFVRRHRVGVAAVAAIFVTLAAAAAITSHQAAVAREERRRAEENLARAEEVAAFLTGIFEVADPAAARGRPPSVFAVLDQGVRRMRFSLRDDPRLRADLLGTLGRVYQKLGSYERAGELLGEAEQLREDGGGDTAALAASRRDLAALELERGRLDEARELANEALRLARETEAADPRAAAALATARCLRILAEAELALANAGAAEKHFLEALEIGRRHTGPDAEEVSFTRNSLGELYYRQGDFAKARQIFAEVLATRHRTLGADHPDLATSLNNLAVAELALGNGSAARDRLREVLQIRRQVFGENHDAVANSLNNLAAIEAELGDLPAAVADLGAALAISRQVFGGAHPVVAGYLNNLGSFELRLGRFAEAGRYYQEALAMRRETLGPRHPEVAETLRNLGQLEEREQPERAAAFYREALAIDRETKGSPERIAESLAGLGRIATCSGELRQAESLLREEIALRGAAARRGEWRRPAAEIWLGRVLAGSGRRAEALALMQKALAELAAAVGPRDPRVAVAEACLAIVAGKAVAPAGLSPAARCSCSR